MLIRYGFDIEVEFSQPTTILTAMDIHPSRRRDVIRERDLLLSPPIRSDTFTDAFGNTIRRLTAQPATLKMRLDGIFQDDGCPDESNPSAEVGAISAIPAHTLPFLTASRYCETDLLSDLAWSKFSNVGNGWATVQAICDFVHDQLTFSYAEARETRTAVQALEDRCGVCRDFAHLAVALCRCMNIPARYCNGYLGDIGVPPDPAPMDFNAWFEAFLNGRWYTFDARHNQPRIGRILISRGRDAADVAMITSYGPHRLRKFEIFTEEMPVPATVAA